MQGSSTQVTFCAARAPETTAACWGRSVLQASAFRVSRPKLLWWLKTYPAKNVPMLSKIKTRSQVSNRAAPAQCHTSNDKYALQQRTNLGCKKLAMFFRVKKRPNVWPNTQTIVSENPSSSFWDEDFKISAGWSYLGQPQKFLWIGMGKTMEGYQESPRRSLSRSFKIFSSPSEIRNWSSLSGGPGAQHLCSSSSRFIRVHQGSTHDNSLVGRSFSFHGAEKDWGQDLSTPSCPNMHVISYDQITVISYHGITWQSQKFSLPTAWSRKTMNTSAFSCATNGSSAKDAKCTCSTAVGGMLGYLAGHQVLNMVKQTLAAQHGKSKQKKTFLNTVPQLEKSNVCKITCHAELPDLWVFYTASNMFKANKIEFVVPVDGHNMLLMQNCETCFRSFLFPWFALYHKISQANQTRGKTTASTVSLPMPWSFYANMFSPQFSHGFPFQAGLQKLAQLFSPCWNANPATLHTYRNTFKIIQDPSSTWKEYWKHDK